jgi:hypothetical protein
MTPHDDTYEAWKRRRAGAPVPADFADRVLAGLRRQQRRALLRTRAVRIGVGSLAAAVCLCRILQVIALFLTGSAGG